MSDVPKGLSLFDFGGDLSTEGAVVDGRHPFAFNGIPLSRLGDRVAKSNPCRDMDWLQRLGPPPVICGPYSAVKDEVLDVDRVVVGGLDVWHLEGRDLEKYQPELWVPSQNFESG